MSILDRYIGKAVMIGTLIVMAILLTLLGIIELMKELGDVGVGDYSSGDAMLTALLSIPRLLFNVFPITALIGSLLGLGALAGNGELTAMRTAGVSTVQLTLSVLKTGLLMLVFVFIIGEVLGPLGEEYANKIRVEKQQQQITLKSKFGFWARDGEEFINIRKILPGSRLEDIYIYEIDKNHKLKLATHAQSATYQDETWVLENITQTSITPEQVRSRRVDSASWDSMIDPGLLSIIVVEPKMLPAWGLYQYMSFMQENRQDATAYEVAFWSKIVTPMTTLVMLFLAVPFVLGSLREVSVGQRVFVGAMIGTVFYVLNQAFSHMSVLFNIEPVVATSMPGLILLGVGVFYLRRLN